MKNNNTFFDGAGARLRIPEKIPGLPYLLLVGFVAAIVGGAFQMDEKALLLPATLICGVLLLAICLKKARNIYGPNDRK